MIVLLIDDSRTSRHFTRSTLKAIYPEGLTVLEADDGIDALVLLGRTAGVVDLILCDWNMPRMDGISFLKHLKAMPRKSEAYVIMITTESDREHVAQALRWGARDYILKPFTEETLRRKLEKMGGRPSLADTSVLLHTIAQKRSGARDGEEPSSESGFSGSLDTLPIQDLIQILHASRKTGHLRLARGAEEAGLHFTDGELRHAWTRNEQGETAFYGILGWKEARFSFDSGVRPPEESLSGATMPMLLEGLRRLDEGRPAVP
jgi:two-component system chemotaxis response regulator CheY